MTQKFYMYVLFRSPSATSTDFDRYLDEAEKDKERYQKELEAYHQTDAYKMFLKKQNEKKKKESEDTTGEQQTNELSDEKATHFLPVFTIDKNLSRSSIEVSMG